MAQRRTAQVPPGGTPPSPSSSNFAYLSYHDPRLSEAATRAERVLGLDPVGALQHLRFFGELLARHVAARLGADAGPEQLQMDRLRALARRGLQENVLDMLHSLRRTGNRAAHDAEGSQEEAFTHLKLAFQLAIWFQRSFGNDRRFDPGPFVPPANLLAETDRLREELEALRHEVAERQSAIDDALKAQQEHAARALGAEAAERKAREEAELWAALAAEAAAQQAGDQRARAEAEQALEALRQKQEAELARIQAAAQAAPPDAARQALEISSEAAGRVELDEAGTRALIDQHLRDAGWEVDSRSLRYAAGVRPQKNKNLAIAEWPTASGPADYALFLGQRAVGVVEAKKQRVDVPAALEQAKRYSRGFAAADGAELVGPGWSGQRVPFLFATNGRPYLKQLETKSGIWFLDARRPQNLPGALPGWYSPEGLKNLLGQDIDAATEKLEQEPFDYLGLRDYQVEAIGDVERALAGGARTCLVAMATGTGKTLVALGLVYRLLKTRRFRRVLFLVDRSSLGQQATDKFKEVQLENFQTFSDIFGLKELKDLRVDADTKLHVATVQGMVRRVLDPAQPSDRPSVDTYDCIVVDECHRGYGLDQEMSETELTLAEYGIRSQADYISSYRRILEYFDAVKIGLTATPAAHTREIFGAPVAQYRYRTAVIEGHLVDHEPPISLVTKLAEEGIHWVKGEQVLLFDPKTQGLDYIDLEDDVNVEVDAFNKRVVTESFNRVVCRELARHIDPSEDGKTLVFAATDSHADLVVQLLKEAFQEQYGAVDDAAVVKITGTADHPQDRITHFKNERYPNVVVTVDLLTTGIDVPAICNLVFLRRVRSRILYEQMLGRATRLCPTIGKQSFRIFDAVGLYEALEPVTDMKPVVTRPNITIRQLVRELDVVDDEAARQAALEQLLAKLQRKQQQLKGKLLDDFQSSAQMTPGQLARELGRSTPAAAAEWFRAHSFVLSILERSGEARPQLISDHQDEVRRVERGYGRGTRPGDYLAEFETFVRENINRLPALTVVAQRPKDLTREQLLEVAHLLDEHGFSELQLQVAWRERTNHEVAAGILGFIRQAALGDPLLPYAERVDRGLQKVLARRAWTDPQRKWLDRIAKQLKLEKVVDRGSLDQGQFAANGGFQRLNKLFEGKLEALLAELGDAIWERAG